MESMGFEKSARQSGVTLKLRLPRRKRPKFRPWQRQLFLLVVREPERSNDALLRRNGYQAPVSA